jgi:predicted PurR-regulated permease PerM
MLKVKLLQHFTHLQHWFEHLFGISTAKQSLYVQQMLNRFMENSGTVLSSTFSVITDLLVLITLIPVYVFLLLLYRNLLLYFTIQVFSGNNSVKVSSILHEIKQVIQNYIVGLLIEAAIVATMNSVALMVLGIPYAILLGVLGAILNLVPYLGGIIAIALPILMALVTKEGLFYPAMVVVLYLVIQFIDNNIIVPKIVASKVRINALISILAVLVGGAIWGISGMFLSIPMVAILKIIFDRVTPLKPWGMLLGDSIPEEPHVQASMAQEHGIIILEKVDD